jgi:hypothetical protein
MNCLLYASPVKRAYVCNQHKSEVNRVLIGEDEFNEENFV